MRLDDFGKKTSRAGKEITKAVYGIFFAVIWLVILAVLWQSCT